jgi:hypothetical protein
MRIILVDDHAIVREACARYSKSQDDMQVVGEFANGATRWRLSPGWPAPGAGRPEDAGLSCVETISRPARTRTGHPRARVHELRLRFADPRHSRCRSNRIPDQGRTQRRSAEGDPQRRRGQPYLAPAAQRQLMELAAQAVGNRRKPSPERETDVLRLIAEGLSNKHIARALNLTKAP